MTNSSWKKDRVDSILLYSDKLLDTFHLPQLVILEVLSRRQSECLKETEIIYTSWNTCQMALEDREHAILSISTWADMDHPAPFHAFHALLEKYQYRGSDSGAVQLVLVGGSRNAGDTTEVENLRLLTRELGMQECFIVNVSLPDMLA